MPNRSISSSLRSNLFRREDIVWKFLKIVSILAQSLAFYQESCPIVVISALRKEESRSRIRGGEPVFRRRKSVSRDISLTNRFQLVHARNSNDRPTVADFHKTVSIPMFSNHPSRSRFSFPFSVHYSTFLQHLHDLGVIISNNFHPIGNNREIIFSGTSRASLKRLQKIGRCLWFRNSP